MKKILWNNFQAIQKKEKIEWKFVFFFKADLFANLIREKKKITKVLSIISQFITIFK